MTDVIRELYEVVLSRKESAEEKSYTRYLFEQGIDKILKKVGEETSEVIIAAKNGENDLTVGEISDLLYHLMVLMAHQNIPIEAVEAELAARAQKSGNLKNFKTVDKNS